jgi:hypothetical protein
MNKTINQLPVKTNLQTSMKPLPRGIFNPPDTSEEFMTTAEQRPNRPIEKITKYYPAFHRVVLRSTDTTIKTETATTMTYTFPSIVIGERLSNSPAILNVESFNIQDKSSTGALAKELIEIKLENVAQFRSYDSASRTTANTIAVVSGSSFWNMPTSSATGVQITALNQLQYQPMVISLRKTGSAWNIDFMNTAEWVLVLNVCSLDENTPL